MEKEQEEKKILLIIRGITVFFMLALFVSGVTVFPAIPELKLICNSILGISTDVSPEMYTGFKGFIATAYNGLVTTNSQFPFLFYGFDWMAFAHIIIAVAFVGLLLKPVRNKWLIYWAMIACVAVWPLAFICGPIRGIPFYWILIDCSFGVFGLIPLYILHIQVKKLEKLIDYKESKY